jgi:GPH family glycoside/pentoside/hexuronide:cation symporter
MLATFMLTAGARQTERGPDEAPVSLRQHLDWLLLNRPLMILIGTKIAIYLGLFASLTTALFFFKSLLKLDEATFFLVFGVQTIVSIVFLPVCNWVARRIGKKPAYMLSLGGFGLVVLTWLLAGPGEPQALLISRAVLLGVFGAGAHLYGQSMLIDTFALDHRLTGQRREGVLAASFSFVEKACMALAPFVVGVLLATLGFDKDLDPTADQSASAVLAIQIGFVGIPVLCQVASIVLLRYYDLTESDLRASG